jgi:hypothetical protein
MAVQGKQVVDYLMQYLGQGYVWGGSTPQSGFDCSGLLQWGFKQFGISIPRVTYDQIGQGASVAMKDLQVGDAVFFDTSSESGPDHVGIYIGNGKMLHAPKTGDVIKITDITSDYYSSRFMGGRRYNGVVGGGDSNTNWSTQTETDKRLNPEELASQYGWAYSFLNSEPSLAGIFKDAVAENWTADKFKAKLRETDFWKNNSETARLALQEKATDPATWAAKIDANKLYISQLAAKVGAAIPEGQLPGLAEQMAMLDMKEDQLRQVLGGWIDFTKGTASGEAGMYINGMRSYADSMGIDMDEQSMKSYAQLMVKGLTTNQDFQNFINEQAVSLFPAFTEQIKAGASVKNIANPYIQMMSQSLEINPASINVKDPMILSALNGLDVNGKPTGKNLVDFQSTLRGDPRWRSTQQAQDKAMSVSRSVLKDMGLSK